MSSYDDLRLRHQEFAGSRMRDHLGALRWDADKLTAERDRRLRGLVAHAKERSPWHARRLRHVDAQTLRADDLAALPCMTKVDLMDHFDEIVTDPRLNRSVVEAHLDNLPTNTYLFGLFIYAGGIRVHPLVFRAVLGQTPSIVEYQVRQTAHGAEVSYVAAADAPVPRLSEHLSDALRRAGLANPVVSFARVREFERLPTGKVKRFIQQR